MIRDRFSLSPKDLSASAASKKILRLSHIFCRNFPRMNAIILGVHADAWSTFVMDRYRSPSDHTDPVCTGMP